MQGFLLAVVEETEKILFNFQKFDIKSLLSKNNIELYKIFYSNIFMAYYSILVYNNYYNTND